MMDNPNKVNCKYEKQKNGREAQYREYTKNEK